MALKHQEEDIESVLSAGSSWTTTMGDLMSSLMILFLALFAFYLTSHAPIKSKSEEKSTSKEEPKVVQEEKKGGPLEKPYIEVTLAKPVLLHYEKMNTKQGMKETLDELKNEVAKASNVKFVGDIPKPERGGLYPPNWVKTLTIKVNPEYEDKREFYVVKKGDTLWSISKKYMMDPILTQELARINNIKDAASIYPGQILEIPKAAKIKELRKAYRGEPPIVSITSNIIKKLFKR